MTEAGGVVRITGPYPPPPPSRRSPVGDSGADVLLARAPVVTRYGRAARTARRRPAGRARRAWSAASAVFAAAGVGALVLLPHGTPSARVDPLPPAVAAEVVAAPGGGGHPGQPPVFSAATRPLPASEPVRIHVPALGMTSEIMELGMEEDGSMEVPPGAYPVGWYRGSSTPGEPGASVLAGHVDWEGRPGAFYGLRELRAGDTLDVERLDGTVVTFRVDRVEEHLKDRFPTEAVYGEVEHAALRLITCGGAFDEDSGDYQSNVVVFATLSGSS